MLLILITYFTPFLYPTQPILRMGYKRPCQIFTDDQEQELADYVTEASQIYYGPCPKEIHSLTYEYAIRNNIKIPQNWSDVKLASADWFNTFLKRHRDICKWSPQHTSQVELQVSTVNVTRFFNNLGSLMDNYHFECQNIYNIDETWNTTVQKPFKIVAQKCVKQVEAMTSTERGTLITVAVAVNALGNVVPPFFAF